jgi:peptide methionine sulfoxide reductase MsrA
MQKATFAAGCFWGVQYYFDQVPGVVSSRVGYTGGHSENPSYEEVKPQSQTDFKDPIVTQIEPATDFYEAEDYHQKYTEKTGRGMCHIPYVQIK